MAVDRFYPSLDAAEAGRALLEAGFDFPEGEIAVAEREDRWCVTLPENRMAWFPMNATGAERLAVDRQVLNVLAARCRFRAPRIVSTFGMGCDLRAAIPEGINPSVLFERIKNDPVLARRTGRALGRVLAEQHRNISRDEVSWLRDQVPWPEPIASIKKRVSRATDDPQLLVEIGRALGQYEAVEVTPADLVLVHGDFWLHNVSIDPETEALIGVFDYDGAAWDDRHHDFRYLVHGDGTNEPMFDAAIAIYAEEAGVDIDRRRVLLYNAICAINFLAFRDGVSAETKWAGRTLAEDLAWVRAALDRLAD